MAFSWSWSPAGPQSFFTENLPLQLTVATDQTARKGRETLSTPQSTRTWPIFTKWGTQTIAKLVYNSNNYGLWYNLYGITN